MTRLLFFGDAGHTGFGTVTWDLGTRLLALGTDVRFLSMNVNWEPVAHPVGERTWAIDRADANKILGAMTTGFPDGWRPDAAILLGDYQAASTTVLHTHPALTEAFKNLPTYHYCPIEGVGLPLSWKAMWDVVHPVAMSDFGAEQIAKVTGTRPPLIYHGVNTDDFYPVSMDRPGYWKGKPVVSRDAAKFALQAAPNAVIALRTDRHMPRKGQNRLIRCMSRAFDAVPELQLVLHCRPIDLGGSLPDTMSKLPVEKQARIILTRGHDTYRGLSRSDLNILYNAADMYVSTSAEGFGLTIAEAIAAGLPAVGMDYSAVPEVIGPAGVLVPYETLTDNEYDHFWAAVDEAKFAEAVVRLAKKPHERRALGAKGPAHIAASFSWDTAARQFADLIEGQRQEMAA